MIVVVAFWALLTHEFSSYSLSCGGSSELDHPSASEDVDVHLIVEIFFASYRFNDIPHPCDDTRGSD